MTFDRAVKTAEQLRKKNAKYNMRLEDIQLERALKPFLKGHGRGYEPVFLTVCSLCGLKTARDVVRHGGKISRLLKLAGVS